MSRVVITDGMHLFSIQHYGGERKIRLSELGIEPGKPGKDTLVSIHVVRDVTTGMRAMLALFRDTRTVVLFSEAPMLFGDKLDGGFVEQLKQLYPDKVFDKTSALLDFVEARLGLRELQLA